MQKFQVDSRVALYLILSYVAMLHINNSFNNDLFTVLQCNEVLAF